MDPRFREDDDSEAHLAFRREILRAAFMLDPRDA